MQHFPGKELHKIQFAQKFGSSNENGKEMRWQEKEKAAKELDSSFLLLIGWKGREKDE